MRVAVFDTNILVSGLWEPRGPSGLLLDALADGRIAIAYTGTILGEYTEVLFRPVFGFAPTNIAGLLDAINAHGVLIHPRPVANVFFPDPDDAIFVSAALALPDPVLVTGNPRHYPLRVRRGITVLSPRQALTRMPGQ